MSAQATSPAKYVNLLLQLLAQQGVDRPSLLKALGLQDEVVSHPDARLPTSQALALFKALLDEHGRADMGFRLGALISPGFLGGVGQVMLYSETLRDALDRCAEFYPTVTPSFKLQVQHQPHLTELTWVPVHAMPYDFVLLCFDMALAAFDGLLRGWAGPSCPRYEVYLTRAEPAVPSHAQAYRKLHARCHFASPGLPSLRIQVPQALVEMPMPMRHAGELAAARERLARQVLAPAVHSPVTPWVSMMLSQTHGEQPSLAVMASAAGLSSRTLSRQLAAEGTTFRDVAKQVRFERACRLLDEGVWQIQQVSEQLGYADVPSFVRAFKAEAGVTPGQYGLQRRAWQG